MSAKFRPMCRGAVAAAFLFLLGCQSSGTEGQRQADDLGNRVDAYGKSMAQGKKEFETLLAAHEKLVGATAGDLRAMYADFTRGINTIEARRTSMKQMREQLRAAAQTYFSNWQTEASRIGNESLRAKSIERMKQTQNRYDDIFQVVEKGIATFEPIMVALKDHAQYLSVELNFEAANSLKKDADKVKRASSDVFKAADAVITGADKFVQASAAMMAEKQAEQPAAEKK